MNELGAAFEERLQEIQTYLDLLEGVEKQVQDGPPRLGENGLTISAQQQRILYSSVYLQLYNLVEATITRCIDQLSKAVAGDGRWFPLDLSDALRREWVRFTARTHVEQSSDKRLDSALALFNQVAERRPVSRLHIVKTSAGNWDDHAIDELAERLGLPLRIPDETANSVKRHYKNDQGPLKFIKVTRNDLAHGILSFAECGEGVTVAELRDLTQKTSVYLRAVLSSFQRSIEAHEFLVPDRRPDERGA
ncbi:MAG TPA: MAE_28990/MAE_18760 family HEPN-like nuclease [Gemmatimonadaceae bacterium]|nr:MAE_28990/MAE_18760 family HEPN-like nuclease [Gemmatimonadaceae bacterium]